MEQAIKESIWTDSEVLQGLLDAPEAKLTIRLDFPDGSFATIERVLNL
jgi:hypothetical protein